MSGFEPADLDPAERRTQLLLAAVPPRALPLGFRDEVMRRIAHRTAAEWIAAAVLALPSLVFLATQLATLGDELGAALNNVLRSGSANLQKPNLIGSVLRQPSSAPWLVSKWQTGLL